MMTDFDPDKLLQTDSWGSSDWLGYSSPSMMDTLDDLPSFLDRELDSIDMSAALRSDMEIPMLADTFPLDLTSKLRYDDAMLCRSDSDSGLSTDGGSFGGVTIKQEPLSPTSSFSSDSTDSHNLLTQPHGVSEVDMDFSTYLSSDKDPPLTPPYEPHDATLSANHNSQLTSVVINSSPNHNQAKIKLANRIHARNKSTNEKTSTSASLSVGSRVTVVQKQPLITTLGPGNKTSDKASPKPIILSADEFQRLASQGVLRFQNPKTPTKLAHSNNSNNSSNINSTSSSNAPISVKPSQQTVAKEKTVANKPAVTMVTVSDGGCHQQAPPMTIKDEIDLRTWKRHQRMIKNRESACLSRKRKKEHLQCLEQQLAESAQENDRLMEENHVLKKRVELLQSENERFRKKFGGKAASLFALVFLLCLNLGPVSNLWQSSPSQPIKPPLQSATSPHSAGRHLLSLLDLPSGEESLNQSNRRTGADFEKQVQELRATMESWNKTHEGLLIKSLEALSVFNDCPSYFNKTESLRLANELTGWVLAHTKANETKPSSRETPPKPRRKIPKKYRSLKVFNRESPRAVGPATTADGGSYQMQLFRNQDRRFTDFFEAIQRRNDTFYVVSFRKDHLLLPATAHNKTMRPRMSLVMPAVSLNNSIEPPDGSVAMMQIDCEVTATRLIHVSQSSAPDQSRGDPPGQSDNATSSHDEATAPKASQEEVVFENEN